MTIYDDPPIVDNGLTGSIRDFRAITGTGLLSRTSGYGAWVARRIELGLWPYFRATGSRPGPTATLWRSVHGAERAVINFASQDYLSLSYHPRIRAAARDAIDVYGVHSAGSAALIGNTTVSRALEQQLAEFLGYRHVLLFPTGWGAGYGAIRGLVRTTDHVVIDGLAHSCLHEGASAATPNLHVHGHLKTGSLDTILRRIRAKDVDNAILVVTESLFSMDSDSPDLQAIRRICREHGATLLVDCAHDLGSLGVDGTGQVGAQGLLGDLDILMGSFSKTFASNGGFVATNSFSVYEYLKVNAGPWTFSNALSPVQCSVILEALTVVRSPEGEHRRRLLMDRILLLRSLLEINGLQCLGEPSPIVPVLVGNEALARLASKHLVDLGLAANLVEYPAVAKNSARFRFQVMAEHSEEQVRFAATGFVEALRRARAEHDGVS